MTPILIDLIVFAVFIGLLCLVISPSLVFEALYVMTPIVLAPFVLYYSVIGLQRFITYLFSLVGL